MPAVQEAIERVRNIDIDQYKYGFVTDIESDKAPRVIQMTVCSVRAWLPGMSVDPLTYIALKFPAPVCNACGIPMVTVTMVFDHATPEAKKVTSLITAKNANPRSVSHFGVPVANLSSFHFHTRREREIE